MKVTYCTFAANELDSVIDYYDSRQPGLGRKFTEDFQATVDEIRQSPTGFSPAIR